MLQVGILFFMSDQLKKLSQSTIINLLIILKKNNNNNLIDAYLLNTILIIENYHKLSYPPCNVSCLRVYNNDTGNAIISFSF